MLNGQPSGHIETVQSTPVLKTGSHPLGDSDTYSGSSLSSTPPPSFIAPLLPSSNLEKSGHSPPPTDPDVNDDVALAARDKTLLDLDLELAALTLRSSGAGAALVSEMLEPVPSSTTIDTDPIQSLSPEVFPTTVCWRTQRRFQIPKSVVLDRLLSKRFLHPPGI